jgi:hypothetical protein
MAVVAIVVVVLMYPHRAVPIPEEVVVDTAH